MRFLPLQCNSGEKDLVYIAQSNAFDQCLMSDISRSEILRLPASLYCILSLLMLFFTCLTWCKLIYLFHGSCAAVVKTVLGLFAGLYFL